MAPTTTPALVTAAVQVRREDGREKLGAALAELASSDPSFRFDVDEHTGEAILSGADEPHLNAVLQLLIRQWKMDLAISPMHVAYCETIRHSSHVEYTFSKQTGGRGQFAKVRLMFEPRDPASGFVFESALPVGCIPDEYVSGVRKGLAAVSTCGPFAGLPMIGVKATLVDGAYHDADSSATAFQIATRMAVLRLRGKDVLSGLEPIAAVEIITPEDYRNGVIEDLKIRRGHVRHEAVQDGTPTIRAAAPMSALFGYADWLARMSHGQARCTMRFDRYEMVSLSDPDPPAFSPAIAMRA